MAKKNRRDSAGGSSMSKFYWILGIVAVVGVGVVGYSVGTNAFGKAVSEPVDVQGLDDPTTLVQKAQPMVLGDENAPISIIEFGDFQCPACGQFYQQVEQQVRFAYIDPGKAKYIFYDFPLVNNHPHAFIAARAARCAADQNKFWPYHDTLYKNQASWAAENDPVNTFVGYARDLGLNADTFEACIRSDAHADVVTANMRLGQELGVNGTPTVMVSRGQGMARRVQRNTFDAIQEAVEAMQPAPEGGSGGK